MRAAMRKFREYPALSWCLAVLAAMTLTGCGYLAAGVAQGSRHTAASGGGWLFAAFFLATPGFIGWHLAKRQRKITVERKLDEVADGLDEVHDGLERVEGLLAPKSAPLAVVRELPHRK